MFDKLTLQAVISLAELGNFKDTAEATGVSRVKLTRLIQRAELDCGFCIFERGSRRATPTAQGRQLIESCIELNQAAKQFDTNVGAIQAQAAGPLVVACGPLTTDTVLRPLLQQLLGDLPGLPVLIVVRADADPVRRLRSGELDLFIGDLTHTTPFDDISVMVLEKHDVIFAANPTHPIHRGGPYSLADILEYPLALPHLHRYWRQTFDNILKEAGRSVSHRIPQVETDDYQALIALAANTDLLTGGTAGNMADAFAAKRLRQVSLRETIKYNICAARRKTGPSPGLDEAWALLRESGASASD